MTTGQTTKLRRARKDAEERLRGQISEGRLLEAKSVVAPNQFRLEARAWLDYNAQFLKELFTTNEVFKEFMQPKFGQGNYGIADQYQREIADLKDDIQLKLPRLNSILKRLEFFEEESSHPATISPPPETFSNIETVRDVPLQKSDYRIDPESLNPAKDSLADEWLRKLKNNPLIAGLVVLGVVLVGIAAFTESITKINAFIAGSNKPDNQSISTSRSQQPTTQQEFSHSENDPLDSKATSSDENARVSLRELHKVRPLQTTESNLTLSEVSRGVYGFVSPLILAGEINIGKRRIPLNRQRLELRHFEIHKLITGEEHVIGFVGSETASQLRRDIRPTDLRFSLYANRWSDAQEITSLPLSRMSIERFPPREIELDNSKRLATLDIHLKR